MDIDITNYNIQNCNIQKDDKFIIIRSNNYDSYEIKRLIVLEINDRLIDMINDVHESFDYIKEFLLLNMFSCVFSVNHESNIYYNSIKELKVIVGLDGYSIHGLELYKSYKSQEFLEVMCEKLELNDVNKLVAE
jgi:hypothetical protein